MILIVARHRVRPEYAGDFPRLVEEFTAATRAEPGTISFEWSRSTDDPAVYFLGRTVSLAARVADQSRSGDVVALREVLDQADQSLVQGRGDIATETFTTGLRGLARDQHLVRLIIADAGPRAAQAGTGRPRRGILPWG
jgi:hypothetical protein